MNSSDPTFPLPPKYALKEEIDDVLVLRRADQSVVERFFLSLTGPDPQMIQQIAEKDYQRLREGRRG